MQDTPRDSAASLPQLDELVAEYLCAVEAGQAPDRDEWLARHPALAGELRDFFHDQDRLDALAGPLRPVGRAARLALGLDEVLAAGHAIAADSTPLAFGEYELVEVIAAGGMGI